MIFRRSSQKDLPGSAMGIKWIWRSKIQRLLALTFINCIVLSIWNLSKELQWVKGETASKLEICFNKISRSPALLSTTQSNQKIPYRLACFPAEKITKINGLGVCLALELIPKFSHPMKKQKRLYQNICQLLPLALVKIKEWVKPS